MYLFRSVAKNYEKEDSKYGSKHEKYVNVPAAKPCYSIT